MRKGPVVEGGGPCPRLGLIVPALVCGVLVMAGCGGEDGGGDGGSSSATAAETAASPAAAEAQEFVAEYLEPPTGIGVDEPLKEKPPAGKELAVISCSLPTCLVWQDEFEQAVAVLDWSVTKLPTDATPEDTLAKMREAIDLDPDGIVINGLPRAVYEAAMPEAIEKDIPVVAQMINDPVEPPLIAVQDDIDAFSEVGTVLGNWVIASSDAQANALLVQMANFPIGQQIITSASDTIKENCPDCEAKTITVQAADVGQTVPGRIVSELQRNPDMDYVVLTDASLGVGLVPALREAGLLDRVRITGTNASPEALQGIKDGTDHSYVQFSVAHAAWQGVDALARHFVGQDIPKYTMPVQILTEDNVQDEPAEEVLWNLPRDKDEQFTELWLEGAGS